MAQPPNEDEIGKRHLPMLVKWLRACVDLKNKVPDSVTYDDRDHFTFMCLCFWGKQVHHGRSVLALGENPDVDLISRSMVEGMVLLTWAARDPETRGLLWRSFSFVHDWRLLQEKDRRGDAVDAETRKRIEKGIAEFGALFLTKAATRAQEGGGALPTDPYVRKWTGTLSTQQLFADVQASALYAGYGLFSNWQHWNAAGLAAALKADDDGSLRFGSSLDRLAHGYAVAIQSMLETATRLDLRLNLGLIDDIHQIELGYTTEAQRLGLPRIEAG